MKQFLTLLLVCGLSLQLWAQSVVTGTVTDAETGEPLEGATVLVKGTTVGMFTNDDGEYRLELPANAEILVISYVGRVRMEIPIQGRSVVDAAMQNDLTLDEVVVTGYGTQSKQKVISSVAIVGKETIEDVPMVDITQILQGQAPGLMSTSASGDPNTTQTIRIRGTGSISAGRQPLFVIDGIISSASNWSDINPNTIESVSVLKDATATALYGSRGANGVIVITTKKGVEGPTRFNLKVQRGITLPSNPGDYDLMSSQEALQYEREVLEAGGIDAATIEQLRPSSLADVETDWHDLVFETGQQQRYELSAAGGSARTNFFIAGEYYDQEGHLIENRFQRYTVRANISHKVNDKLEFGLNTNLAYLDRLNAIPGNRFSSPLLAAYIYPTWMRYKDPVTGELLIGNEDDDIINFGFFTGDNPIRSQRLNPVTSNGLTVLGNFSVAYKILPWLKLQEKVGVELGLTEGKSFFDPTTLDGRDENGRISQSYAYGQTYTNQTLLTGGQTFGDHTIDGLAGFEFQKLESRGFNTSGIGLATGKLKTLNSTATPDVAGGTGTESSFVSYFSQLNYNFRDKYYLSGSIRRDASSRFGANHRWATFYSVGGSWRISEEGFMRKVGVVSNLKLRASFGTAGNAGIGNFAWQELYGFGTAYNNTPGSAPSQVPNPELRWEIQEIANIGLDFGFFKDRITGSVEIYNKDSKDLLLSDPVSSTSGFTSALRNIGELNNRGLEATVAATIIDRKFKWNVDFNISFNRNEVVALNDTADIPNGRQIIRIGEPIRSWYIREWAGVNPADGTPLWRDSEGGVTGSYNDAPREIVGNAEPDFFGGFTNTFSFAGVQVSAFFYFMQGHEIYDGTRFFIDSDGARVGWSHPRYVADRWRQPGDIAERPQAILGGNNQANSTSTRFLSDGSYVRLRNLTVAYTLPGTLMQKLGLNGARVFIQGQNIWTYTDYIGFDPELAENGEEFFRYPNGKAWTGGLELSF